MGGFGQRAAQPRTALAGLARLAATCTGMVAWTHARPRGQALGTGKRCHIHADLSNQHFGNALTYPRNGIELCQLGLKRLQHRGNLAVQPRDRFLEGVNLTE
jgi:hypothetical protein